MHACRALKLVILCRQESYFHYLFGVEDEDYYGALDLRDGRTMLFMPRLPEAYAVSNLQLLMRLFQAISGQYLHQRAILVQIISVHDRAIDDTLIAGLAMATEKEEMLNDELCRCGWETSRGQNSISSCTA